ncbi:MAG: response regulator [bacterium]|nr:response regulator [bacterium]
MTDRQPALFVDDNDDYVKMLQPHLKPYGFDFERAWNAAEGLELLRQKGADYYRFIVTDISMEGQLAGMKLIRGIRKFGYKGPLMVASTGFNVPLFLNLLRPIMALWGVDLMVPKKPLKQGRFEVVGISKRGKRFIAESALA